MLKCCLDGQSEELHLYETLYEIMILLYWFILYTCIIKYSLIYIA
jgi:hypothetical protein